MTKQVENKIKQQLKNKTKTCKRAVNNTHSLSFSLSLPSFRLFYLLFAYQFMVYDTDIYKSSKTIQNGMDTGLEIHFLGTCLPAEVKQSTPSLCLQTRLPEFVPQTISCTKIIQNTKQLSRMAE